MTGISEDGMKALQVMQLALQYLSYSQQILIQKIKTTKMYIEKQKEQVHVCQELDRKQKAKIKSYEKAIEGLNEQAVQYELLARRVCPEIFQKNADILGSRLEEDKLNASKSDSPNKDEQNISPLEEEKSVPETQGRKENVIKDKKYKKEVKKEKFMGDFDFDNDYDNDEE